MWDKVVRYRRVNECLWDVYIKDHIGYSLTVECYAETIALEKIENEMYKRFLKPREFKFIREDGSWLW